MAKFQALPHSDLPAATRARVGVLLNARLADTIDLQLPAKQAHWNVKGPHFIALHELFDKVADAAEEAIDDADRAGDKGTSDLFTELSRDLDQLLWLVEAHLQSPK